MRTSAQEPRCGQAARLGQHRKARIARNQVQPRELPVESPANPAVSRTELERTGLPPRQAPPLIAPLDDIPETAARKTLESHSLMPAHHAASLRKFAGARKTRRHPFNGKRLSGNGDLTVMSIHDPALYYT